jgi:glycerophosphoryl diester phosphodiesterase
MPIRPPVPFVVVAAAGALAACAAAAPPGATPSERSMLNIAHRGASGHAPEHTMASFELAFAMGVDYLEQDLQMTADGVLVVLHDDTLDRTARGAPADCTGPVIEKTLEQIRRCDVGSWFNDAFPERARPEYIGQRVPTLEELFERFGHSANYYIETKNPDTAPGMEEALLSLLDRFELREPAIERQQVLIQSFSEESLRKLHGLDNRLPLIQLVRSREPRRRTVARLDAIAGYAVGVGPARGNVDATLMAEARARGLYVHVYTVNDVREMERMRRLGVDGIFTDFPDRLAEFSAAAAEDA